MAKGIDLMIQAVRGSHGKLALTADKDQELWIVRIPGTGDGKAIRVYGAYDNFIWRVTGPEGVIETSYPRTELECFARIAEFREGR